MSLPQIETPAALPPGTFPALRLLPAPVSEPPYDDERTPADSGLHLVGRRPAGLHRTARCVPTQPVRLRVVTDAPSGLDEDDQPRTMSPELPGPRAFAHALVQRLLETCAGVRPIAQLQRDTSPELFAQLEQELGSRVPHTGPRPTSRDVRSLHVQQRPDGVAEVCATVRRGPRAGAVALRLEGRRGRWVCTELVGH